MAMQKWVASYSGCDGGNPEESSIWFVGIEWGYAKEKGQSDIDHDKAVAEYHTGGMAAAIKNGYSSPYSSRYSLKEHLGYGFGLNSAKLISAIKGHPIRLFEEVADNTADTDIFKLNLYPIGLPSVADNLWEKFDLKSITGLSSKQEYRNYCAQYRFPFFRSELTKYLPQLVLCTGSSYWTDFSQCFCDSADTSALNKEKILDSSPDNPTTRFLRWKWVENGTLLVVVPFMSGPSGLNSDELIQQFGDRIKGIMEAGPV